jgi:CubicO group peptidase (beta-lactamase class C family)
MHLSKLTTMVILWVCSYATVDAQGMNPKSSLLLTSQIDRLFEEYDSNTPSASALVIQAGQVIYQKSFGRANIEDHQSADSRSNYRLASLSKAFTAFAVLILIDRQQLELDHKLNEVMAFPSYGNGITIRHLLNHTSGLRDYENHISPRRTEQLRDSDVADILRRQNSLLFNPGTQYRYSNSGYAVLAEVVRIVSGQSFADFLRDHIFEPLEMTQTVAYEKGISEVTDRAYGYTRSRGTYRRTDQSLTSAVLGDGGIYTSLQDLAKWDAALYSNNLIRQDLLASAFKSGQLNSGIRTNYGFGWKLGTYRGFHNISHTGSTIGFRTAIQRYPQKKLTVVVLINLASTAPWDIARQISDIVW